MSVSLFRIQVHIREAFHAESILLSLLFVEVHPANVFFSPFDGERCIDKDGAQPGTEARPPAEPFNASNGAQHRFLNQILGFIASLPAAIFCGLEQSSWIYFARKREILFACQLHCILHMRRNRRHRDRHTEQIVAVPPPASTFGRTRARIAHSF